MVPAVVSGGSCMCMFGTAPCTIMATSQTKLMADGKPVATIMDNTNLVTFGSCSAPTNPAVIAALGSPVPCKYVPAGTWIPKQMQKLVEGKPILTSDCNCMCAYAGMINIVNPGQTKLLL